jgi:hypothetical protein
MNDLEDIRRVNIQALGAALSLRDWHQMEVAYNKIRDRIDQQLTEEILSRKGIGFVHWSGEVEVESYDLAVRFMAAFRNAGEIMLMGRRCRITSAQGPSEQSGLMRYRFSVEEIQS